MHIVLPDGFARKNASAAGTAAGKRIFRPWHICAGFDGDVPDTWHNWLAQPPPESIVRTLRQAGAGSAAGGRRLAQMRWQQAGRCGGALRVPGPPHWRRQGVHQRRAGAAAGTGCTGGDGIRGGPSEEASSRVIDNQLSHILGPTA